MQAVAARCQNPSPKRQPQALPVAPKAAGPGRKTLGSGLTDASGRFRIVIPRLTLRPGTSLLSAQVWPRHSYLLPSRSAELPLTILPPEPVSLLFYVLPVLLSGGAVVLMLLGRWLVPQVATTASLAQDPVGSLAQSTQASQSAAQRQRSP